MVVRGGRCLSEVFYVSVSLDCYSGLGGLRSEERVRGEYELCVIGMNCQS